MCIFLCMRVFIWNMYISYAYIQVFHTCVVKYLIGIWRYFILEQVCLCWLQFDPAVRVGKINAFFLVSSSVGWMYFFGYAFRNIMTQLWHSSFTSGANWWQSVKSILSTSNFQKTIVWWGFLVFWFFCDRNTKSLSSTRDVFIFEEQS